MIIYTWLGGGEDKNVVQDRGVVNEDFDGVEDDDDVAEGDDGQICWRPRRELRRTRSGRRRGRRRCAMQLTKEKESKETKEML